MTPLPSTSWSRTPRNTIPRGITQAYSDIGSILSQHGFRWVQGSLYVTENEDMANLFLAIQALRYQDWFPKSVRDIRAFRIEQWSDFTKIVKSPPDLKQQA